MNTTDLAIYIGRFQGLHKGHQRLILDIQKRYKNFVVLVVEGKGKGKDKENKNPFSGKLRQEILDITCPGVKTYIVPNGFIPGAVKSLDLWNGESEVHIVSGEDRDYSKQESSKPPYKTQYITANRGSDSPESGTELRNSLIEKDFEKYKKIAATGIDNKEWFDKLSELLSLKESTFARLLRKLCES